jgi:hypothetical protein
MKVWMQRIGVGVLILVVAYGISNFFSSTFESLPPYQVAMREVQRSEPSRTILGDKIVSGSVAGAFRTSGNGTQGFANLVFPVKGSRGQGTVEVSAVIKDKRWLTQKLRFQDKKTGQTYDLLALAKERNSQEKAGRMPNQPLKPTAPR